MARALGRVHFIVGLPLMIVAIRITATTVLKMHRTANRGTVPTP